MALGLIIQFVEYAIENNVYLHLFLFVVYISFFSTFFRYTREAYRSLLYDLRIILLHLTPTYEYIEEYNQRHLVWIDKSLRNE